MAALLLCGIPNRLRYRFIFNFLSVCLSVAYRFPTRNKNGQKTHPKLVGEFLGAEVIFSSEGRRLGFCGESDEYI